MKNLKSKEFKKYVGEYVETGVRLIGVGKKYVYYYSIWDDGKGSHSGYMRTVIDPKFINDNDYQFINKSLVPKNFR
jgi:hypothetical protein